MRIVWLATMSKNQVNRENYTNARLNYNTLFVKYVMYIWLENRGPNSNTFL
jgi:hypothetical protein